VARPQRPRVSAFIEIETEIEIVLTDLCFRAESLDLVFQQLSAFEALIRLADNSVGRLTASGLAGRHPRRRGPCHE
jgi:hypothetical protein